jgi:tryptophanyl-tRNA synthetase
MSKSLGNTINLRDDPEAIRKKLAIAVTDPNRKRRNDPGNPDVCNVFALHNRFSPAPICSWVREGCTTAAIGCVECKRSLGEHLGATLAPIRARALELQAQPAYVREVLGDGAGQARALAAATMTEVRRVIGIDG